MTIQNHTHPYTIVASDLDGTLLAPNHQLSAFSKQTLQQLHQQGLTFVFATGRHHVDVHRIRQQVNIPAYMITSNGARVHDQHNNLMYSKNLPSDLVQSIVAIGAQDPTMYVNIYQDDRWLLNQDDEQIKQYFAESGFQYQLFEPHNAPTDNVAKVFFTHPNKDHDYLVTFEQKLREELGNKVTIAFSTPWCLEIMAAEVSKGEALKAVAQSLAQSLDNCIAFGDGMNDVEMLQMAHKGLVMQTAHSKVHRALPDNEVIGSNEDDAVAHYLCKTLLAP